MEYINNVELRGFAGKSRRRGDGNLIPSITTLYAWYLPLLVFHRIFLSLFKKGYQPFSTRTRLQTSPPGEVFFKNYFLGSREVTGIIAEELIVAAL